MDRPRFLSRRAALRIGAALVAAACTLPAAAHSPPLPNRLVMVDVYDRTTGAALPVYEKDGRHFVVGSPGHEYAVRIRNCTGGRILAVTSVDGVNVISGDTASPDQSGYVIEPWGSVEIAGWRKSFQRTAAFYFSEHSQSYAARTGRPFDVGVIGVAAFEERRQRVTNRIGGAEAPRERKAEAEFPAAPSAGPSPVPSASEPAQRNQAAGDSRASAAEASRDEAHSNARRADAQPLAKLGTGHGRSELSHARQVRFERASADPAQWVSIQYDRAENLVAMGVIPAPPVHHARREPRAFPGVRFAPDPR